MTDLLKHRAIVDNGETSTQNVEGDEKHQVIKQNEIVDKEGDQGGGGNRAQIVENGGKNRGEEF